MSSNTVRRAVRVVTIGALLIMTAACGPTDTLEAVDTGVSVPVAEASTQAAVSTTTSEAAQTPLAATTPVPTHTTETVTAAISFKKRTVEDSSLDEGVRKIRTRGVPGVTRLTYEVTIVNGVRTRGRLLSRVVLKAPVTQVTLVGTKVTSECDPNYSGACVPIASDVDCAGGSGNGPAYVEGPVTVVGSDIYDLDRDGDGIGCE